MKITNRKLVFDTAKAISVNIGDIAQNDCEINEADLLIELVKVDAIITKLQNYKSLLLVCATRSI